MNTLHLHFYKLLTFTYTIYICLFRILQKITISECSATFYNKYNLQSVFLALIPDFIYIIHIQYHLNLCLL